MATPEARGVFMRHNEGLIFDIQGYSVHDGPGCRTLVFLSGCPLRCRWCANPESWEKKQRVLFRATKCVHQERGCVRCRDACVRQAIRFDDNSGFTMDCGICRTCERYDCVSACLHEGLALSGKSVGSDEVMRILNRDRQYWGSGGGVTFTGGEPFFQKEFLKSMLQRCREAYIHTAIETSALTDTDSLFDILQYVDWAFVDLKHMDATRHREQTGVGNEQILKNISTLARSDWPGMLMIRIPIIGQFNDDDANIRASSEYLLSVGLEEVNILPFHRLGDSKWRQLGMTYPYSHQETTSDEKLRHIGQIFQQYGITCYIGSSTPF
jgi:glycyl-radical enzyme activating protein